MLRCSCDIFRPFTQVATKKFIIFRCHSVLKIPLGCSCNFKKNILLNVRKSNQFELELQKSIFIEPKNYFFTSTFFLKEKGNKKENEAITEEGSDSKKTCDSFVCSDKKAPKALNENAVNINGTTKPINESRSSTQIFGSLDTVENIEISKKKLAENQSELQENNEKVVLSDQNKTVSGIESKVAISSNVNESQKILKPPKTNTNADADVKRDIHKLDLGLVNKDTKLVEPPGILDKTERDSGMVKLPKDGAQNALLEKAKSILRKTTATLKAEEPVRPSKIIDLGPPKGDLNIPTQTTRRRQTVDLNKCSTERNFITPVRAMTDFLLKPSDLEGLRKTKRRSPYENDPPITVYWRKDVEAKAIDVWGSKENLLKEILKRDIERRRYQQNLFTVKRRLRDYRREQGRESEIKLEQNGLLGSSGKVVLTAVAINGTNFLFKLLAWLYTGSHSMFSEAIHSLADTINQLILAYGIHKSVQRADSDHPYGYTNMRYVASLISGVGIFCVGSGLSCYHGFVGLTSPSDLPSFYWAYFILAGSLASEGATLLVAFNSIRQGARKFEMSLSEYVLRGQDPSVNVVLLEDMAAVIGVGFAASCMGLSSYYESHIPDAIGSFLVGGLLAGVASFIIYTNVAALVGRSIPQERLDKINAELESDVMIRAIHDVKGIDIGNSLVRYKAEMDFDGGELTRSYLDKQDLNQMLEEVRKMQTIDELEEFMLKHGENIVDMMGGEIDRIELKLRKKHPEIRHCDLEIL